MKLSIPIAALKNAVSVATGVIDGRITIPILGSLDLLSTEDGMLYVTSSNLDQFVRTSIKCDVAVAGGVALPASRLSSISKIVTGDTLDLETDKKLVATLKTNENTYRVGGLAHEEFPSLPKLASPSEWAMPARQMRSALSRVAYAQSDDPTRESLNGVFFEARGGEARWVACDGRQLAMFTHSLQDIERSAILPSPFVRQAISVLAGAEEVNVRTTDEWIGIEASGVELLSKLSSATYPNYRQVIPTERAGEATADRVELLRALRRVTVIGQDKKLLPKVRLKFADNCLRISAKNEADESHGEIALKVKGSIDIACDGRRLDRALTALDDEEVSVRWLDNSTALVFEAENSLWLILPIREVA